MSMRKLWLNLRELWHLYWLYDIFHTHPPYTLYGIKQSLKMLKLLINKEDNA